MGLFSSSSRDGRSTQIKVLKEEPCRIVLSITVPPEKVREETDRAFERIQPLAKIPGFRAGKVPLEIVRSQFADTAARRAREALLEGAVQEAVRAHGLELTRPPVIKALTFEPGKPCSFELEAERAPRVELKNYKGLKVERRSRKVTDEDVSARLEQVRESNARLAESSREKLEPGLFAVVDYEGAADGRPVPGAKGTQVLVDTQQPQLIAGLAEGIMGMVRGESREIPVDFPADSPAKALAGRRVTFKVKLHDMKEKRVPDLNDDLARDLGCESLEDLKKRVRTSLEEEAARQARQGLEKEIEEALLTGHPFPVPPSLLEEQVAHALEAEKHRWLRSGGPEDEWNSQEGPLRARMEPACERDLRMAYLIREICRREGINVEESEVEEAIGRFGRAAPGENQEALRQALLARRDGIASDLRHRKVFDFLIGQAKVKEVAA